LSLLVVASVLVLVLVSVVDDDDDENDSDIAGSSDYYIYQRCVPAIALSITECMPIVARSGCELKTCDKLAMQDHTFVCILKSAMLLVHFLTGSTNT
jgi:hypothetical protein